MTSTYMPKCSNNFPKLLPKGNKDYVFYYVKRMISELVYDMGNLENNPFTFPEVQTLLEGITVGGHRLSDQNQLLNIKESWDCVMDLSRKQEIELTKETLCSIHNIVARDEALIVGAFRTGSIGIAGTTAYKCIDASVLNKVFDEGIRQVRKIENPLEKAIILNVWLSYCKFFFEGNRRTASLAANLILLNNRIGILSVPAIHKIEYNALMIEFYETLDATKISKFLVTKCVTFFDGLNSKNFENLSR